MKVLSLVSYKILPAKLGGQKGIALFNEYLAKECDLICVTILDNDPQFANGYKLLNVLSNSKLRYINVFYFFTLRKIIKQQGITHLIIEHSYYGWLGILLKWFCSIKLIVHSHNIEGTRWKALGKWWWWILQFYERQVFRLSDYIFFKVDNDKEYALSKYGLQASKCITITYGIEWLQSPTINDKNNCREKIASLHHIDKTEKIFLFNGTLDYKPNLDGLMAILNKINPVLAQHKNFRHRIIICGNRLPESLKELKEYNNQGILYAGFVDDITVYFKGSDVFLNPITDGGGIKTKLVEAIGYSTPAVSSQNGSIGVGSEAGDMLQVVPDNDWNAFAMKTIEVSEKGGHQTPESFYEKFYWGNIAKKAANFIQS